MKCVIQRVQRSIVKVNNEIVGQINQGLLILLAVHKDDDESKIFKMADKVLNLRIFEDENGKMNLSLKDIRGGVLVVSQFTLYGDARKGNRPSFMESAGPQKALPMYENFVKYIRDQEIKAEMGRFGEHMEVSLVNDGPVTIIIDL